MHVSHHFTGDDFVLSFNAFIKGVTAYDCKFKYDVGETEIIRNKDMFYAAETESVFAVFGFEITIHNLVK